MAENSRNEEKPNDEDLRTKKPTTSFNQLRATVRGNIEDVVAYINRAREAQEIAAHDLEKANNWLNKSQELLTLVLAAISVEDTPKETQSSNPDAVVDNVDTNVNSLNPDNNPEQARSQNNYTEAETHDICEAEQLKMEVKLFPVKPKNDDKPSVSSSYAGVTVEGNPEDVVACINNANKAFAEKDLEQAKKWLIKSQRMRYTVNAQELLNQVLAAIAARDALKEIPKVNTNAGPDDNNANSIVNPNPEQTQTRTLTEHLHNDDVGAKKCIDTANKAFKAGDFDKAERLLLKAKRMDASIDVEQYLKLVHESKARDITSKQNAVPEERPRVPEPIEQTNHNMDEANTYLTVAENAFNDKRYERALQFLDKSEALFTLERAVKLREQVQDAMSNAKKLFVENFTGYFTREKPSKPNSSIRSRKEKLDELITAIRNDIDAGNLDKAYHKLLTPGFGKAVQLKKLRIEVEKKMALRTRENMPKAEQSNPEPVDQTESLRDKMLSDIHAEEAETCINVADKAYCEGDLDKAERLLRKAERLSPTERAKKALEILFTAKEEKKRLESTESIFNYEVKQLIDSGLHNMENQNYYSADMAFQRAKHLQPDSKYIDELLTDVQTKIKNRNAITGSRTFSTPESMEGTSMGTQNRRNEKPTNESDRIAAATKYADWAQDAYNSGDIEHAEFFIKLADVYNSTERNRNLLVMTLKAKHGIETNESDDDGVKAFVVVDHSRKKKPFDEGTCRRKGYLRSAEDAFIKGEFYIAKLLITKPEVSQSPYVTDLTNKINALKRVTKNSVWFDNIKNFF